MSLFHTMTLADIKERSSVGGVHICLRAIGYCVYYEATLMHSCDRYTNALAAANTLAADHNNQGNSPYCEVTDWSAVAITEEDTQL